MVIGRRSLLLAGVALPAVARAQCVTDTPSVDACGGGVRITSPPGISLDLSFLTPGTLDPRITFTRASTATYFDSAGTLQTATTNAPRWDYDPVTHVLRGMLIEEARTNLWLQSADASNAAWVKAGTVVAAPVVTGNQVIAPDGTTTAASVAYPAVSGVGALSIVRQTITATVNPYALSIWMRGSVGGEQIAIMASPDGVLYYKTLATLTTGWQRFSLVTPNLTAVPWFMEIGTDLRDATQTAKSAQTVYLWGAQFELGAFSTSYIPTTAASVTRAAETCTMPIGAWYSAAASTLFAETMHQVAAANNFWQTLVSLDDGTTTNRIQLYRFTTSNNVGAQVTPTYNATIGALTPGAITKAAVATRSGQQLSALNGVTAAADVQATTLTGLTTLAMGKSANALPLNGWMRRVRYWPRALSAGELQAVTT
jgi:hypothetical protein